MKTLTLHIENDVFYDLEANIQTKRLSAKFCGVSDMIGLAIIGAVKNGQKERSLRYQTATKIVKAVGK